MDELYVDLHLVFWRVAWWPQLTWSRASDSPALSMELDSMTSRDAFQSAFLQSTMWAAYTCSTLQFTLTSYYLKIAWKSCWVWFLCFLATCFLIAKSWNKSIPSNLELEDTVIWDTSLNFFIASLEEKFQSHNPVCKCCQVAVKHRHFSVLQLLHFLVPEIE